MFFFRINRIRIHKNREVATFPWEKDEAEIELWSFITTDNMPLPDMSDFLRTTSAQKKKEIIADIAQEVLSIRKIAPIEKVKDNQVLTFGDTGYVLLQTETIPEQFDWNFMAIELDQATRDRAAWLKQVVQNPQFGQFTDNLTNALIKTPSNPGFQALVAVGRFIINVVMQDLENNQDDLVGILLMSLNRREHYRHGERKRDGVPDLTQNMWIDYSMFGFDRP